MVLTLFNPTQLTLLRELEGVPKNHLAKDLDVSPATITGWENGSKSPTTANVARLCMRFGVDPEYFNYQTPRLPSKEEDTFFRSLRSTTAKERAKSNAYASVVERIITSFEPLVNFPSYNDPMFLGFESPEMAAQDARKRLEIADGPINNLMESIEDGGIFAVFGPLSSRSVDAFSRITATNPLIVMNPAKNDYYRQRFDLAHELGHLVMHNGVAPGSKIEAEANQFASEFLMPSEAIIQTLPTKMDKHGWAKLRTLKEIWGVSLQALLYRARELEALSASAYQNAMATISKKGWRRHEPGNRKILEIPTLLPSAVTLLKQIGYTDTMLAKNAGVPVMPFKQAVSHMPLG